MRKREMRLVNYTSTLVPQYVFLFYTGSFIKIFIDLGYQLNSNP